MMMSSSFEKLINLRREMRHMNFYTRLGKVEQIVGMIIEVSGLMASIGDVCEIRIPGKASVLSEVVGFRDGITQIMPYDETDGIGYGNTVYNTGKKLRVKMGDALIGRTVDALGRPIDGLGEITDGVMYPISGKVANPMRRPEIREPITLGVKAIDGMITLGKGQRIGIFAGSGVGKSTLMGMIARNVTADVNVLALVGERGRELMEFLKKDLGPEGLKRSVVVVATSDRPALLRNKAAKTATAVAEYFRDKGKDVLLMMDSLTRFSMAQREIGLASGEPPVTRGYPPSVYAEMPKLLERAGNGSKGSITGLYTVLVDGDDFNEPITDTARSILDGHVMLSRQLAHQNHYPAIDVLQSISRCMSQIASKNHKALASKVKTVLATYQESEDLINIGAYQKGSSKSIDYAIEKIDSVNEFLMQQVDDKYNLDEILDLLAKVFEGE